MTDSISTARTGKGDMVWGILMLICGSLATFARDRLWRGRAHDPFVSARRSRLAHPGAGNVSPDRSRSRVCSLFQHPSPGECRLGVVRCHHHAPAWDPDLGALAV